MSLTSENWKLGAQECALCGKNQGRGTVLVSSWSEFRTKANGLFFFPPFHLHKRQKKWQFHCWGIWGTDPTNSQVTCPYPVLCPMHGCWGMGRRWGCVAAPIPRVCDTTLAGEARQGGLQEGLPPSGYMGAPEGAWKRRLMRSPAWLCRFAILC